MAMFECNVNSNLGSKVYYLGTATSYNLKTLFPNDYTKITANNILIRTGSSSKDEGGATCHYLRAYYNAESISYNASTGALSISVPNAQATTIANGQHSKWATTYASVRVYVVIGNIENI